MPKNIKTYFLSLIFLLTTIYNLCYGQYPARNVVWDGKLTRDISFLCDSICYGRATGTGGNVEAAFWIIRRFEKCGLQRFGDSYVQHFYPGNSIVGHNIVGFLPGSKKKNSDKYIIVGAHYDHLGKIGDRMFPGADANASGVVAMLSIADMFSTMKLIGRAYNCNIIFVAFDAKEYSMAGSYSFWKEIEEGRLVDPQSGNTITKETIKLMVNLDQLGCSFSRLSSGRDDYLIALDGNSLKKSEKELLRRCNTSYQLNLEISDTYYGSESFTNLFYNKLSDQRVFVENKVPAVMFTSGITMNNNKTKDNPESINYPVFKKRIYLIWHWLEYLMW